ncbi:RNA-binding S4 domain-containing protein [Thioalkalivibrio sp. HK1]|uniref:RNA-binding S4 domain-containing protein n=1 Tax=Thioalkalivibrio sp. HK1 TaxID=1469245 RepID=UPI00046F786F|nr:RNA-binding S4 domain-containing protein [Thioalkalivibrio sp. HK1]
MTRLAVHRRAPEPNPDRIEKGDRDEPADDASLDALRIDKWLWAARFFKTRSAATQAISGGHVRISDQRIKPSRKLRRGESVRVRRGMQEWEIVVIGLYERRRSAPLAQRLYQETQDSIERRTSEDARRERAAARRAKRNDRHFRRDRREGRAYRSRGGLDDGPAAMPSGIEPPLSQAPPDRSPPAEDGFEE